jgi:hypothetical protein
VLFKKNFSNLRCCCMALTHRNAGEANTNISNNIQPKLQ